MDLPTVEIPVLTGELNQQNLELSEDERAYILVVDDKPDKAMALTAIIDAMQLVTITAHSGREALRQLLTRDFALILLDVHMPTMDGYETAQLIHSRPRSAYTPIIFVTAEAFADEDRTLGYTTGAVDWIFSPIKPEILKAKIGVFVDLFYLTRIARRQAQELTARADEITRKNLLLEASARLKDEFLANMSHELRTPLTSILGFSELFMNGHIGTLTPKQKTCITDVHEAGKHLLALINDILDLSKVESGHMTLEPAPMEVAATLRAGLALFREQALAHHLRLTLELPPAPAWVIADERRFKQILYNLLSNALKFSSDGGEVRVVVRRVARAAVRIDPPEGWAARLLPLPANEFEEFLEVAVSDSGIGISDADLQRLFQAFIQLDSTAAREYKGTGLGLALIRRLAALHGGTVGVLSAPGRGTVFVCWVPWRAPPGKAAPAVLTAAAAETETPLLLPSNAPLALMIEDDHKTAILLRIHLENEGFRVIHASDGMAGLLLAKSDLPALITLDLLLPELGGWEVLTRLKADPHLAAIPVVIVSMVADQKHGYALGATATLQKPIQRAELLEAIQALKPPRRRGQRKFIVLLVDDDPKMIELVTQQLKGSGCVVLSASSGREALAIIQQGVPDLIILDLMMPGINGFEVVSLLKMQPQTAHVPIMILTAKVITPEDRKRLSSYVVNIVEKSDLNRETFITEVRRALRKKVGERGGKEVIWE